ncbi:hypothetical protein JL_14 [Bacillus phage JL]|uniref:Uncharacterized protein n=1 Tax=Bacillus phage JL TaxID=1296655 RepID=S5MSX7_9CAUD|nr:hypothetical protein AVV47_gp014 [Bacillus phage JL]AGR46897.1 hypothetical protein JL_14 [Bacillus phage JL]
MSNPYVSPSKAVLDWLSNEVRNNMIDTNEFYTKNGEEPIEFTQDDIEAVVQNILEGLHESIITPNVNNRLGIKEEY